MKTLKKLWAPMLLGMVLAMILTGAAGARPLGGPLKVVTVSAADCIPTEDWDWHNLGLYLRMNSGSGSFTCPVHFPEYGTKRVRIIRAYIYDNHAGSVQVVAYRTAPASATQVNMTPATMVSTTLGANPQILTSSWGLISNEVVTQSHGMYVWVHITAASLDLKLYGFKIAYV